MTERRTPAFEPLVNGAKDGVEAGYRALESVLEGLRESTRRIAPAGGSGRRRTGRVAEGSDAAVPRRRGRAASAATAGEHGRRSTPPSVRVQAGPSTARSAPATDRAAAHVQGAAPVGESTKGGPVEDRLDGLFGLLADALHYASELIDELGDVVGGITDDDDDGGERDDDCEEPSHQLTTAPAVPGGEPVTVIMHLRNHSPGVVDHITFRATDLTSGVADIGRDNVSFDPDSLRLGPRSTAAGAAQVTIAVRVPKGTPPGTYRGTVHAVGSEAWGLLVVEVVEHHRLPDDATRSQTGA